MTEEALCDWLSQHLAPPSGPPRALSGGALNLVWRVPLSDGRSVVAKWAPPYVASQPHIPLDPARVGIEAQVLALLAGPLHTMSSDAIRAPRLLAYDPDRHLLITEDLGDLPDLGCWLGAGGEPTQLAALGEFLAQLHDAALPPASRPHNQAMQTTRKAVQYDIVGALAVKQLGAEPRLQHQLEDLGTRLLRPGHCLIMGDLWLPSILVDGGRIRLIDWELSHWGQPAQDLGHLMAHLWMAHDNQPGSYLFAWRSFWNAYCAIRTPSAADLHDSALHFGAEVLARSVGPFRAGTCYQHASPAQRERAARVGTQAALHGHFPPSLIAQHDLPTNI